MRASSVLYRCLSRALFCLFLILLSLPGLAAAQAVYHVLAKGETLYSVARSYGVSVDELVAANSIGDPSRLKAGTRLLIPGQSGAAAPQPAEAAPRQYKVAKGDTLFSIARSYGVSVDELRKDNKLGPSSVIRPGDLLDLPAGAKARDPAPLAATPASTSSPGAQTGGSKKPSPPKAAPAVPEAVKTSSKLVDKGLSWPCQGEILYLEGKVYGIVIKAKEGAVQKAVAAGTVSSAGPYRGYGNVVFVLSRGGYIYVYGGNDSLSVKAGDKVVAGQALGKVGMDAKQGCPAAYFLVFKNGEALDPATAPRD